MRLFAAVVPSAPAVRELRSAMVSLPKLDITWTDPADWHLTLVFFGDVPEDRRPALSATLADVAARTGPVRIHLSGGGHFDSRVLWAAVGGGIEGLHSLSQAIRKGATTANVDFDSRPFRPHLTLAFARRRHEHGTNDSPADIRPLADALTNFDSTPWNTDKLLLMSTRPGHSPSYTIEESWNLT
ncbi:RNA 2',3'-cyclic phosphodiesterase [Saccharopolyspora gregorii]|uniref:RNA 2',3'-cyclic phosphodiesterase n=1 Tax=Saccharopolyspora gregorii TaxID=33914 RepID=A0ABP6RY28_9PSEU